MDENINEEVPMDQTGTPPVTEQSPPIEETIPDTGEGNIAKAIEYINRFAPESDTSTPEGIMAGLLAVVEVLVPFQDKMRDVVEEEESAAAFLYDVIETGDTLKALVRNHTPEEVEATIESMREDDDFEGDRKIYSERISSTQENKARKKKNIEVSIKDMSDYIEQKNDWTEEKANAFMDFVVKHYDDAKDGSITKENILILEKGFKYDGDMAEKENQITEAENNGRAIGRNEQIVAKKATKEELEALLPKGSGGGTGIIPTAKEVKPKTFGTRFLDGVI